MNKKGSIPELHTNKTTIYLITIICLGIFLRIYNIGRESIWYDEAVSIHLASAPIGDIISGQVKDLGNPPLHNILLHYWLSVFGNSEFAARSLSALFGILCIFLIYKLINLLLNKNISLLAAFIFAISPLHVYLSQEARTYTLVTFLCLASMFFFIKFLKCNKLSYLIGYIVAAFLSIYSHYFACFILMSQNIFLFIYYRKYKHLLSKWIVGQLIIFLLYLIIWVPSLISQISVKENLGRSIETWFKHIIFTPVFYSVGRTLIWKESSRMSVMIYAPLVVLMFGIPFILGMFQLKRNKELLFLLILWLFIPIIVPTIISILLFPLYCGRYSVMATPAWYTLIGLGISSIRKRNVKSIFISGVLLLSSLSLVNYYSHNFKFEWRLAADYIERNSKPDDLILFDADIGETPFSYYYKGGLRKIRLHNVPYLGDTRILGSISAGSPKQDFTAEVKKARRVWLVLSDNYTDGAGDFYENLFNKQRKKIKELKYKGIKINLYSSALKMR